MCAFVVCLMSTVNTFLCLFFSLCLTPSLTSGVTRHLVMCFAAKDFEINGKAENTAHSLWRGASCSAGTFLLRLIEKRYTVELCVVALRLIIQS